MNDTENSRERRAIISLTGLISVVPFSWKHVKISGKNIFLETFPEHLPADSLSRMLRSFCKYFLYLSSDPQTVIA